MQILFYISEKNLSVMNKIKKATPILIPSSRDLKSLERLIKKFKK